VIHNCANCQTNDIRKKSDLLRTTIGAAPGPNIVIAILSFYHTLQQLISADSCDFFRQEQTGIITVIEYNKLVNDEVEFTSVNKILFIQSKYHDCISIARIKRHCELRAKNQTVIRSLLFCRIMHSILFDIS